jgi:hypothetical protein
MAASGRETTIDGLLRGWPLPVERDGLEKTVAKIQDDQTGRAWTGLLARLQKTRDVDLRAGGATAGLLGRGNIFFRVVEIGVDASGRRRYAVTPTYVVVGPYLEVWDSVRHTVTIETPAGNVDLGETDQGS